MSQFCGWLLFSRHFSSEEWNKVSKSEREKLGVTVQDDGEFWWVQLASHFSQHFSMQWCKNQEIFNAYIFLAQRCSPLQELKHFYRLWRHFVHCIMFLVPTALSASEELLFMLTWLNLLKTNHHSMAHDWALWSFQIVPCQHQGPLFPFNLK